MALRPLIQRLRGFLPQVGGETLDVVDLLARCKKIREDAGMGGMTTTANVGAYVVPLGAKVVRDPKTGAGDIQGDYPVRTKKKKKKR